MASWPSRIKAFKKWSQDQIDRGTVAGDRATSFRRKGRKWRMKRRKKRNKDG